MFDSLIQRLGALDPAALDWYADQYDSAFAFRMVIEYIQRTEGPDDYPLTESDLRRNVNKIAKYGALDGFDWGYLPCPEPHLSVWNDLLAAYGEKQ
jgi:hypothetical protein